MRGKTKDCKTCGETGFVWGTTAEGRWKLMKYEADGVTIVWHNCAVREVKEVTCKYCGASDLWWSKEKMEDNTVRNVLMESYGIPHGLCDQRKAHIDAVSQAKKDKYAEEKARINAIPDGSSCPVCINGVVPGVHFSHSASSWRCRTCGGNGKISPAVKERMLWDIRKRIWPNIARPSRSNR